ncbi:MAG: hypothetical protein ACI9WU_002557, partial [Myxococcota bacterium]
MYSPIFPWFDAPSSRHRAQLAAFDGLPEDQRDAVRARIEGSRAKRAGWAETTPANLAHRVALLDAERAHRF